MTKQNYKYFPILQHYYIKNNIWQKKKACRIEKQHAFFIIEMCYLCSPSIFSIHTMSYHLPNFFPHL